MPIYEYICQDCGHPFEVLVRGGQIPACEKCASTRLEKQWSVPAAHTAGRDSQLPVCDMPSRGPCGMGGCGLPECG
jgi:putative FmdB family regulatory protein